MKHIMDRRLNRQLALRLHASPSGMRLLLGLSIAAITPVQADGGFDVAALQARAAGSAGGTATDPNGGSVLPCAMAPARTSELGVQVRC